MFGLSEAIELLSNLTKLGASPAVQQFLTEFIAQKMGVPQHVLDAAIRASHEAPAPKA